MTGLLWMWGRSRDRNKEGSELVGSSVIAHRSHDGDVFQVQPLFRKGLMRGFSGQGFVCRTIALAYELLRRLLPCGDQWAGPRGKGLCHQTHKGNLRLMSVLETHNST